MNLFLLAALGLSTLSQTVVASPAPAMITSTRGFIQTTTVIEQNPDKALCISVAYTPDYALTSRADLFFSQHNPPKNSYSPFKFTFLCPDCPIAVSTPNSDTTSTHRVFTPFTLEEVSFPISKTTDRRAISFRVEYIPPQKPRTTSDYVITFYDVKGKPGPKFTYEKKIPCKVPINYIVLKNNGGNKWCDLKYEVITIGAAAKKVAAPVQAAPAEEEEEEE
ncbi:hypothetical protein TWF481_009127 [Arthrobotrys musiformis]|uniref:Uncharacterized protein n=1 Tax=Arthrobotrys musiformis TaxID=47236 RepID=A0AAV9W8J7_9PEZI